VALQVGDGRARVNGQGAVRAAVQPTGEFLGEDDIGARAMDEKIAAIEAAQQRGTVTSDKPAGEILALVLSPANMWQHHTEDVGRLATDAQRRAVITDAVRRLVTPDESARG
jgi:hypothetical protein